MEKFFVSRPIFALSLAIVIVIVGLISILNLPIEQYPDITPPVVEVSATYDGADAETVNNAVATPVAQSVMGVSDMLYLQTTSANDGSMVMQVTFDIGSDPDLDAIFTQNNVSSATAQLPATVTKQGVTTRKTMTGFLLVFSLHSDGRYDAEFLSNYAYINLQNELLKIDGVGKVSIMGAGEYAMRVWLKPDVLKYYGIPVSAVTAAIENQGGIYPAGQFGAEPAPDGTSYTYTVTMPPQITTAEQFGDIVVVTTSEGEQIRLRDVADTAFASGDAGIHFELRAKPARDVMKTHLVIDGQELEYFNQKERWQRFNWPDEQWQPGASLSWTSTQAMERILADYRGSWSLIRLLEQAQVTPVDSSTFKVVWKAQDGLPLNYLLRVEQGKGPLALLELKNFRLPGQVFLTGKSMKDVEEYGEDADE